MSKYGEIIFYAKYLEPQLQAVKNVLLLHLAAWILRIIEYLQFQVQIIYLSKHYELSTLNLLEHEIQVILRICRFKLSDLVNFQNIMYPNDFIVDFRKFAEH